MAAIYIATMAIAVIVAFHIGKDKGEKEVMRKTTRLHIYAHKAKYVPTEHLKQKLMQNMEQTLIENDLIEYKEDHEVKIAEITIMTWKKDR